WTRGWSRCRKRLQLLGRLRLRADLDLLARLLQALDADPKISLGVFRRLDSFVEGQLVRLHPLERLLQPVHRLLVGQLLVSPASCHEGGERAAPSMTRGWPMLGADTEAGVGARRQLRPGLRGAV